MPISVTLAPPNSRIGPGIGFVAESDFVGAMPTDSGWFVDVSTNVEDTNRMWREFIPWQGPTLTRGILTDPQGFSPELYMVAAGATVYLTVQLYNGSTGLVDDSGQATGIYDPVGGLGVQAVLTAASTAGAFTDGDRATVNATLAGVSVSVPAVGAAGGAVLQTLGQLLQGVPPNLTNRHGSTLISGQGSIARLSEPFRGDALGIEWHWNTVPAAFGVRLGSLDEYFNRIVQFRLIDQDDSGQFFQRATIDSNAEGERYVWGIHSPVTLEYFVTPGCVVELSFLVLVLG